jgi:protein-tyrosine-phosphatase
MQECVKGNCVRILFVCYGNSCRSQMAEALANQIGGRRVRAFSAGTHPLGVISLDTRVVLNEKGIRLVGHWSKGLRDVPISEMDVVVEMGFGVKFRLPADFKGRLIQWHIPDPYLLDRSYFRDVRDLIESEVRRLLANLTGDSGNRKVKTGKSKMEIGHSKPENGKSKSEKHQTPAHGARSRVVDLEPTEGEP